MLKVEAMVTCCQSRVERGAAMRGCAATPLSHA